MPSCEKQNNTKVKQPRLVKIGKYYSIAKMTYLRMKLSVSRKWLVLWSLWAARLVHQPTPELQIESGLIRGYVSHDGSHVSYLGIPYATVGPERRFKAPGPPPKWENTYDAINEHIKCRQRLGTIVLGKDNCLILNIHTPLNVDSDSRLPVMIFIHGGAFFAGSGSKMMYGPSYLVSKEVILVTVNYRLNIQGFLCLRTKDAPGNAAMKDQVAALRWVKRNIRTFGGDPDNVTLFGESAGGASVSHHLISPMSRGLFHKVIMQSGSSVAPWAYQLRPIYMTSLLTKTMGYKTEDPNELYKILISKHDDELILTRVPRKEGNTIVSEVLYAPCSEIAIDGEEPFLTEIPYEVLRKGNFSRVPIMIGANSEEGLLIAKMENDSTILKIDFEKSLPKDIVITSDSERREVADTLKRLYMGTEEISKDTIVKLSKYHGEPYFNVPGLIETELILESNHTPVYNYLFNYTGWRNLPKLSLGKPYTEVPGATHADDLFYLFRTFRTCFNFFENEMIETMTSLWTNFAKYGDPTPPGSLNFHWEPTKYHDPQALVIGPIGTQPLWYSASLLYWKEIYQKYRRKEY